MFGRRKACGVAILKPGKEPVMLIGALAALVITATSDAAHGAKLGCHAPFTLPAGWDQGKIAYNAVTVRGRKNISCSSALLLGASAWSYPGLKPVYGLQYPGGDGGTFHVGPFHGHLNGRGSGFRETTCQVGGRIAQFYDHRDYWAGHSPGWSPPGQKVLALT